MYNILETEHKHILRIKSEGSLQNLNMLLENFFKQYKYEEYFYNLIIAKNGSSIIKLECIGISFLVEVISTDNSDSQVTVTLVGVRGGICKIVFNEENTRKVIFDKLNISQLFGALELLLDFIFNKILDDKKHTLDYFLRVKSKNKELQECLSIFSKNSDYHFKKWFDRNNVYKVASEVIKTEQYNDKTHVKKYRDRPYTFSGLTKQQAFLLELYSLAVLNKEGTNIDGYFPKLVGFDKQNYTITTSFNGVAVNELVSPILVNNLDDQCEKIVNALEVSSVIHLDDHFSGKNLVVNQKGVISLIDFDIAVVNNICISLYFEKRLLSFYERDGYRGFLFRMKEILRASPFIEEI